MKSPAIKPDQIEETGTPYTTPQLTEYGTVETLTQGGNATGPLDLASSDTANPPRK